VDEQELVQRVTEVLREQGGTDEVLAAGIFFPRGHTGAMFAGGFVGDGLTSSLGNLADSVGTVGGALAGAKAHDAASGLPERIIVAVTSAAVLGFDSVLDHGRRPTQLVFALPRERLEVTVHPRVNVRILELSDSESGASVQLEGSRMPPLHVKDVIRELDG
jgi:hypothetical protein